MQTTLPDLSDLPFHSIGIHIPDRPKSATNTTAYLRIDLPSFSNDIDNAIWVSMEKKGLHPGTMLTVEILLL